MKKSLFLIPLLTLIMSSCSCAQQMGPATKDNPSEGPVPSGGTSTTSGGSSSSSSSSSQPSTLPEVIEVNLNKADIELNLLDEKPTDSLVASVEVRNGAPQTVSFSSSNEDVATVNQEGTVVAKGTGFATIRATSTFDNTKYAESVVRVISPKNFSFDPTSVTSLGSDKYSFKATSGSESIDLVIDGAEYIAGQFKVEGEAYFYNVSPMGGIDNASYTVEGSGSHFIASSFLSRNPLTWDNILNGKYSDLFAYVGSTDDIVYVYGSRDLTMDQTMMPSLKNYAYFMIHLKVQSNPIYITSMSATNDGANLPAIPIGENQGLFTQDEKSAIKSKTNNCYNPYKMGNGAYCVEPYDIFGINQFIPLNQRSYFETDLLNDGFSFVSNDSQFGTDYYVYQKTKAGKCHTFVVQYINYAHFRLVDIYYTDFIGPIVRTTTWPSQYLEDNFKEEHASIIPVLDSDKIEAFECSSHIDGPIKQITVTAVVKEGETFSDEELNEYTSLYQDNFYNYHSYDGLFAFQCYRPDGRRIYFNFAEYSKFDSAPDKETIASAIGYSNENGIAIYSGNSETYYFYHHDGYDTYFTYTAFNVNETSLNNFINSLEAKGYTNFAENSYQKVVDVFGSYIYFDISNGPVPNSYSFRYTFVNVEEQFDEINSFNSVVDIWDKYFNDPAINALKGFDIPENYTFYANEEKDTYVILNAGQEFLDQLEDISVAGLYDLGLYSLEDGIYSIIVNQYDEGLLIKVANGGFSWVYDYTYLNDAITSWSAPNNAKFSLYPGDHLPNHFQLGGSGYIGFAGSKEEVTNLYNLILSRMNATSRYIYSRLLDAYYVKSSDCFIELSMEEIYFAGSGIYSLDIYFGSYGTYDEYQAYDDYEVTQYNHVKQFMAHFPELPFSKTDKVITNLTTDGTYMKFDVEGSDTSYINTLVSDGFIDAGNGGVYKIIDGQLYTVTLTKKKRTVSYHFAMVGEALNSESLYNYDSNQYHDFLDEFSFNTYFTSSSNVYVFNEARVNESFSFSDVDAEEANNYINHLYDLGFEMDDRGNYVKYLSEARTSYLKVSYSLKQGAYRFDFEKITYLSWNDLAASLVNFDINAYADKVEYPTCYGDDEIFRLESDSSDTICFTLLNKDIDTNTYIEAIMDHPEYNNQDDYGDMFYFYFNDNSRIIISFSSEEYISVEIYINTSH